MNTIWNQDTVTDALYFAAQAHGEQMREDPAVPYITHVFEVCSELMRAFTEQPAKNCELALLCAALHDTIEDTEVTYIQLQELFGTQVADGVQSLTKNDSIAKDHRIADAIECIKKQPREVAMVKLADRISNLRDIPSTWSIEKANNYAIQGQLILDELGYAHSGLAKRLKEKIKRYKGSIEHLKK